PPSPTLLPYTTLFRSQALVSATLGTKSDEQKIETLEGETWRHFMLHYNFPSFSVGEVRRFGGPSRRDIGHGALAERAVEAMLPRSEEHTSELQSLAYL